MAIFKPEPNKPYGGGLHGFPSTFAAFKYLDAIAQGPCSWRLNGYPGAQLYRPDWQSLQRGFQPLTFPEREI